MVLHFGNQDGTERQTAKCQVRARARIWAMAGVKASMPYRVLGWSWTGAGLEPLPEPEPEPLLDITMDISKNIHISRNNWLGRQHPATGLGSRTSID